jgi:hypothetical protein
MLSEETKTVQIHGSSRMFTIKKKTEFRGTLQDGRLIKSVL